MKPINKKAINDRQKIGDLSCHHNDDKQNLLNYVVSLKKVNVKKVYEYFSGHNYCTKMYENNGWEVEGNDLKDTKIDSFRLFHAHIYGKRKFDLIDLDPYGLPFRFFPDVYLLLNDKSILFVTSVKFNVPIVNWRRINYFMGYFGKDKPSHSDYIDFIIRTGLCHGFKVEYLDGVTMGKNTYRMAFYCEKQKTKK